MFEGKKTFSFRACLAKALQSLMLLQEVKNILFSGTAEAGNPIDRKVGDKFRNLCIWVELKPDLAPLGGTCPIRIEIHKRHQQLCFLYLNP
jgi:hypothetical protein